MPTKANSTNRSYLEEIRPVVSQSDFRTAVDVLTRINFVAKFNGISMTKSTSSMSDSYYVLLRISFAWSAFEQFSKLVPKGKNFILELEDLHKALHAGDFDDLIDAFRQISIQHRFNPNKVTCYGKGKNHKNLMNFAEAVRNCTLHATINPNRANINKSKRKRHLLVSLSDQILTLTENELDKWVVSKKCLLSK